MNPPSERTIGSAKLPNLVQQFSVLNFLYIVISNFDEKSVTFGTTFKNPKLLKVLISKELAVFGIFDTINVNCWLSISYKRLFPDAESVDDYQSVI